MEQKLVTMHSECLAGMWAVTLLRPYLEVTCFTIQTDREALRCILNMSEATCKKVRWGLKISESEFDIIHRMGVKHLAADALSQMNGKGKSRTPLDDELTILAISPKSFASAPSPVQPKSETI